MTSEQIQPGQWRLTFDEHEAAFIIHVLAQLGRQYQEDREEMSPALRAYWDGSISRGGAKDDEELKDAQEILAETRAELRSQRLDLVETWIQEYELAESRAPWQVEVTGAERDEFVSMLNDRRLMRALEMAITEAEMEAELSEIPEDARRHAILEIDFLGHFIMAILGPQSHRP